MEERKTAIEQETGRRYLREFAVAFVGYVVVLLAIILLVDFETAGWWKYPIALLPVVPAFWGVLAISRHFGRVDEMQQRVMHAGWSLGFASAMIAAMTTGFLGNAGLDVGRFGPWVIYAVGMMGWVVGSGLSASRLGLR